MYYTNTTEAALLFEPSSKYNSSKSRVMLNERISAEPDNYSGDPYRIIRFLFSDGSVADGRTDLERLFKAAFPDELISDRNYTSLLLFSFERTDKLIDAAHNIYREKRLPDRKENAEMEKRVIDQVKLIYRKAGNWDLFPRKLKPEEWINPRLVIYQFFMHQSFSHWKGKLHEILQAALRDESICYYMSDHSKLYWDLELLERLVEAIWLIKLLELS
jgi:hypothetical protein